MKALIVDDEPHVLAVARLLVDWEKYHIHQLFECMDATEALEIIEREQPAILLSDIRMPQMDGLTLIEKAREKNPNLKSILISAYSDFFLCSKSGRSWLCGLSAEAAYRRRAESCRRKSHYTV